MYIISRYPQNMNNLNFQNILELYWTSMPLSPSVKTVH